MRLDRVRADTTVVEANVAYPTDSGLLAKGVAKLARLGRAGEGGRAGARTTFRDRTRSVRRRAHDIGAWLRRRNDDAKAEVRAITGEVAGIAERTVVDARHVAANARRGLRAAKHRATGKTLAVLAELERTAELVERIAAQTRVRLSGETPDGSTRIVSLHDPDARPIAKGRLWPACGVRLQGRGRRQHRWHRRGSQRAHRQPARRPDTGPSHRTDQRPVRACPSSRHRGPRLRRSRGRRWPPRARGQAGGDPPQGPARRCPPGQRAHRSFRKLVKWRTGSEARISCLKRDYGWRRTLTDGETGAATWCGWGVLAHNATKISALAAEAERQRAGPANSQERPETAAG